MTPPSRLGRHLKLIATPYGKSRTPTLVIVLAGLLLASMLTAGPAGHPAYARTADSSIEFAENGTRPVGTFWAYDQDGDAIVWSLSGPDDDLFAIDGGVTVTRWVWELSDVVTVNERGIPSAECMDDPSTPGIDVVRGWTPISGATSAVYAPRPADVGRCLRATASYTDNIGAAGERVTGVLEVPVRGHGSSGAGSVSDGGFVNAAPVFPDQDFLTEGDQSDSTSRKVAENTKAGRSIGSPVSARDDDGDLLIYTLTGADAASFGISRNSGQLKTRAALNYEARDSYTVEVTATDPSGAMDSIVVTINVTDEDDPAVITVLKR